MKILIVCGEYFNQSNGLSISTQRFVKEFVRLGEEVRVLSSDHGGVSDYSVPVMHIPLVDGIMDKQNYHFAKPDANVVDRHFCRTAFSIGTPACEAAAQPPASAHSCFLRQ